MNRRTGLVVLAGIVVVALAILGLRLWLRPPAIQVRTAAVSSGRVVRQVLVTGTLQPARTVQIGTQVSGTLSAIQVDFNSIVHANDVVARLDPAIYEAALEDAQAKLAQTEAELAGLVAAAADATVKFQAAERLLAKGLIATSDFNTAHATSRQADASVASKRADLLASQAMVEQAQVNLDHTIIRSPIDGVVVSRSVDIGQTVAASLSSPVLFNVADLRHMQLLAEVNEADIGGVHVGSRAVFQVESQHGREFEGKVSQVRLQPADEAAANAAPATTAIGTQASNAALTATPATTTSTSAPGTSAAKQGVVNYVTVIDVDNPDRILSPGTTAIVTLEGAERPNVVRLPNNALTFRPAPDVLAAIRQPDPSTPRANPSSAGSARGTSGWVWRYESGRFVPIAVMTGLADDTWTELISGDVHPGDQLVTAAAIAPSR